MTGRIFNGHNSVNEQRSGGNQSQHDARQPTSVENGSFGEAPDPGKCILNGPHYKHFAVDL